MGQTLTNGIFLPNKGERNCYEGLAANWRVIDGYIGGYNVHVADAVIHVSQADRDKWDAVDNKADSSALTAHTGDTTIHVTAADKEAWNGKADSSALTAHTGDTTIHVTAADKEAWNGKADASALTAHTGNTTIHVTAEDKTKWDAVTGKANDADVLHKAGDETIPGAKTFSTFITSDGSSTGDEYSSNASTNLWLMARRDTDELSGILIDTYRQNTAQGTGMHILGISIKENSVRYEGCRFGWYWDNSLNGYYLDFKPTTQGTHPAVKHNLGTSIDKWDTINGLNPGSLSLPDLNNGIDISGYITAGNNHNEYTPSVDGWISVALKSTSGACALWIYQNDLFNGYYGNTSRPGETEPFAVTCLPVKANTVVNIDTKGSNSYVYAAKFFPCQGNV